MKHSCLGLLVSAGLLGCAGSSPFPAADASPRDIKFRLEDEQAVSVEVAGSFNDWRADSTPMRKMSDGGWTVTVKLEPGAHQYMFVIDDKKWILDPASARSVYDGFGRRNSLVIVE